MRALAPVLLLLFFFEDGRIHQQHNREGRSTPSLACDFDAPAVLPHDVLRHPEAESGPFLSRREERLEDARQLVRVDADARIADLNRDGGLKRLLVARGHDPYFADTGYGLLRVEKQVEEDLPQLVRACAHIRKLRIKLTDN